MNKEIDELLESILGNTDAAEKVLNKILTTSEKVLEALEKDLKEIKAINDAPLCVFGPGGDYQEHYTPQIKE